MDAQTLLLDALAARWESYRNQVKTCRREYSEEAVHDLRVAARRLLALTDLLRKLAPQPRLQKIRQALKEQLDELDELRDTQVLLAEISENLVQLPELKPFQKWLHKRERGLLREAEAMVEGLRLGGLARQVEKVRASLTELPASVDLPQAVDEAYSTVIQRYERIDPARAATIHRTRVAFKKFRYMVEIIWPVLPVYPERNFKRMHAYQTAMGEIQDTEVFLQILAEFAEADESRDVQTIQRHYEKRHSELIQAYLAAKGEISSFWRAKGGQPFPWEASKEQQLPGD